MALVLDTGPILAFLDSDDPDHAACKDLIEQSAEDLVIPDPVLVEVDYLDNQALHGNFSSRMMSVFCLRRCMLYYIMRRRTQLYLDEDQYRWLKQKAGHAGSIAGVVRVLVDQARRATVNPPKMTS